MPKATFDGPNKLIVVNTGETSLDAKIDIYSDWKEWIIQGDNSKFLQALRTVGGDPTTGGQFISPYYFIMNGWRIRPYEGDHMLIVDGNLYDDGGANPFVPTVGNYNVLINLTTSVNAVTEVVTASGVEASISEQDKLDISDRVWDETLAEHQQAGSTGEALSAAATASGIDAGAVADSIWNAQLSDYQQTGSTGEALDAAATASGISVDTEEIADAVWDESTSEHVIAGSFGKLVDDVAINLIRTLGLVQENYYLDNTVYTTYSGIKLLTSGRLRIYSVAGSVGTASDVISTYQITSTWTDTELDTYKVVKV